MSHTEGRYAFLNRVAGSFWDEVRAILEDWYREFPSEGRPELQQRFQSGRDREHTSAFWELHQAEVFRRSGYSLTVHPEVPGSERRPDFLVAKGRDRFYVECTIAGASIEDDGTRTRHAVIFDAINELTSAEFFVDVQIHEESTTSPSLRRMRTSVADWLASLDWRSLRTLDAAEVFDRHALVWQESGWKVSFRPIPKTIPDPTDRLIGMYPAKGGLIDTTSGLRSAVREKASRYGVLDAPYAIAVLVEHEFAEEADLGNALYGSVAVRVPVHLSGPDRFKRGDPQLVRQRDGVWLRERPINTRVSAVITAWRLRPHAIARVPCIVWLNPWAVQPWAADLPWARMSVDPANGGVHEVAASARSPWDLFGIPASWPHGVAFPR